ncbi:MAG TPA: hypothetical protein EYO33_10005 [Phycisphaerales bacterium]|nr:hypothetical protein [Phycisphaerales bacterium]
MKRRLLKEETLYLLALLLLSGSPALACDMGKLYVVAVMAVVTVNFFSALVGAVIGYFTLKSKKRIFPPGGAVVLALVATGLGTVVSTLVEGSSFESMIYPGVAVTLFATVGPMVLFSAPVLGDDTSCR